MDPAYLFEKKFSILQEISSAIVVTDNISSISNLMLDLAINYTNAEKGSLMLLNEKEELYILASRGIDLQFIRAYRVKVGEGIAGTVAVNRLPVLVRDIEADERFRGKTRDRYKTKSFISCPIMIKNKLLGVINLNDKKDGMPFDNDELELIKIIANHAAITIENAFLMNQLKKKASELDDINKKLIDSDIVKSEFITRVSHELRTPLNSIKGAIYYLQESEKITENEKRDFHHIIAGETDKLVSIVENLLNFLRLEDEARIIKKTVISIKDVLSNVSQTRSLKTLLTRGNIQLKILLDEPVSDIVGDRIKVIQLFLNLLEGLCPFLEKGDGIRISAEENDFISIRLRASRRMPESVFQYLNSTRSIFQTDLPEEFLKLYLSRSITDVHQWNLVAENGKDDFRLTIKIPKSIQYKIEAFVNQSLDLFVDFISEVLDLSICSVMLTDELTSELTIRSSRGLSDDIIKRTHVKFGEKIAGWVALEGKPLLVENVETDPRFAKSSISQYNTKSLLTLPVKIDNRVIGVLNLNNKGTSEPFTAIDYYIASALSERFSLFIKNLYDGTCTEQEFKNFLKSFESLLNAEKKFHKKKKSLLPHLMSLIMDSLGASEEERKTAVYVSMIYDLGVGLIDESVLNKKSLSASELRTLRVHPQNSVSLLDNFEYSETVKSSILHHHERYDGHGYPDGLAGEDIPFLSRVLAVADAFCAMVVDRPHRKAIKKEAALAEIKSGSGSIYDPKIVNVLEGIVALL